jgi:hypothetical protein
MPVKVRQLPSGKYRVTNDGVVTAKSTTKKKATNQANLLRGLEHGWPGPTHKRRKRRGKVIR